MDHDLIDPVQSFWQPLVWPSRAADLGITRALFERNELRSRRTVQGT